MPNENLQTAHIATQSWDQIADLTNETIDQLGQLKHCKNIVVTGSGQGIGFAIALLAAKHGHNVVIADLNEMLAEKAAAFINSIDSPETGKATWVKMDTSKLSDHELAVEKAVQAYGNLDVYLNVAGIDQVELAGNISEEHMDRIWSVNIKGTQFGMQAAHKQFMIQRQNNPSAIYKIINTSSIASLMAFPMLAEYCMTKSAVTSLTKNFALEWATDGITVNEFNPGIVAGPMWNHIASEMAAVTDKDQDTIFNGYVNNIPVGRAQLALDVAQSVLFLISSASDYVTGNSLVTDGGVVLGSKFSHKTNFKNQLGDGHLQSFTEEITVK
ncbi:MAG: SDR family oxidoreductase [Streptococcaceae bacterium]|nr:SDR family oxidoreductase [Streptococcaceae bacterium]